MLPLLERGLSGYFQQNRQGKSIFVILTGGKV